MTEYGGNLPQNSNLISTKQRMTKLSYDDK